MSRLRILCLHGFTSNGQVHAHQLRKLTASLPECDFLFPDAPHPVDPTTTFDTSSPPQKAWMDYVAARSASGHRAWWFARDGDPQAGTPGDYAGIETSLAFLADYVRREAGGRVDAIWGFSQGGCFAGLLCALLRDDQAENVFRRALGKDWTVAPRAGVIFSGFRTRFQRFDEVYERGIDVPLLHVMGSEDGTVARERSEKLVAVCREKTVLVHAGGHDIPGGREDREQIVRFVRRSLGLGNGLAVSL